MSLIVFKKVVPSSSNISKNLFLFKKNTPTVVATAFCVEALIESYEITKDESILTRVNSTLVNNDILGTLTNNADQQLDDMFNVINAAGKGAIVFINQQNQSTNLLSRLSILKQNQKDGEIIKAPRIAMDTKDFGIGAQILHDLNISKIQLISNSEQTKRVGMIGYGLEIVKYQNY